MPVVRLPCGVSARLVLARWLIVLRRVYSNRALSSCFPRMYYGEGATRALIKCHATRGDAEYTWSRPRTPSRTPRASRRAAIDSLADGCCVCRENETGRRSYLTSSRRERTSPPAAGRVGKIASSRNGELRRSPCPMAAHREGRPEIRRLVRCDSLRSIPSAAFRRAEQGEFEYGVCAAIVLAIVSALALGCGIPEETVPPSPTPPPGPRSHPRPIKGSTSRVWLASVLVPPMLPRK